MDAGALSPIADTHLSGIVPDFVSAARGRRRVGLQSRSDRPWGRAGEHGAVHGHGSILVRIDAELAKRVPRNSHDGHPQHIFATGGIAGIEAGRRAALVERVTPLPQWQR